MICVFNAYVLHSKIAHAAEFEQNGSPVMFPETGGYSALAISICCESFSEELLYNDTSLGKTIHSFLYLYVDASIRSCKLPEVVELDEVFRDVRNFQ